MTALIGDDSCRAIITAYEEAIGGRDPAEVDIFEIVPARSCDPCGGNLARRFIGGGCDDQRV